MNRQLARVGRRFAPDPASGGNAPSAACWPPTPRAPARSGTATRAITSIGLRVGARQRRRGRGRAGTRAGPRPRSPPGRLEDIVSSIATLLEQNADLIRHCRPRTPFNRCGYLLHDVLTPTSSTWRGCWSAPRGRWRCSPRRRCGPSRCRAAGRWCCSASPAWTPPCEQRSSACRDRPGGLRADRSRLLQPGPRQRCTAARHLSSARQPRPCCWSSTRPTRRPRHASLATSWRDRFAPRRAAGPPGAQVADERRRLRTLLEVREAALPSLYGLRGTAQPVALFEDVGVPPEELPAYLHRVQEILQAPRDDGVVPDPRRHRARSTCGRSSTCSKPEDVARLWALAEDVYDLVLELGGTISTQHGTGLARTPWVARQYGPLYPVFRDSRRSSIRAISSIPARSSARRTPYGRSLAVARQRAGESTAARTSVKTPLSHCHSPLATSAEPRPARWPREPAQLQRLRPVPDRDAGQRMCPIFRATTTRPPRRGPRPT